MDKRSTPIKRKNSQDQISTDPTSEFEKTLNQEETIPIQVPVPVGTSQGMSSPPPISTASYKEMFTNMKNVDIISVIIVFVLIFISCNSSFLNILAKSFPSSVDEHLMPNSLLSIAVAIVFSLIYMALMYYKNK